MCALNNGPAGATTSEPRCFRSRRARSRDAAAAAAPPPVHRRTRSAGFLVHSRNKANASVPSRKQSHWNDDSGSLMGYLIAEGAKSGRCRGLPPTGFPLGVLLVRAQRGRPVRGPLVNRLSDWGAG
ncbi:hypothetical protein IscW_ISCW021055 [Ixodes scapularis]|uniref:Uncharacterized protein n=1 Tax=Ixodes scapularis TaxID=6945 RepID=B7Q9X2_IXOSC|nr:hypothetical protein IscW_ISCW021055 [Ixodes scapularis]|eukprot:XP_002406394.1 hypothetical protein IscW_ISCW021055 [Ixodes scapularis]